MRSDIFYFCIKIACVSLLEKNKWPFCNFNLIQSIKNLEVSWFSIEERLLKKKKERKYVKIYLEAFSMSVFFRKETEMHFEFIRWCRVRKSKYFSFFNSWFLLWCFLFNDSENIFDICMSVYNPECLQLKIWKRMKNKNWR